MKRVYAFHVNNDYSGSPRVLKTVLSHLLEQGLDVELYTSRGGILDGLDGRSNFHRHNIRYRFRQDNKLRTLMGLVRVNTVCFAKALKIKRDPDTVVYVNTVIPFGAAMAARLRGNRVIYHYHENAQKKNVFYRMASRLMQRLASRIICVSDYQKSFLKRTEGVSAVSNPIASSFICNLHPDPEAAFRRRNVLMLCSLRRYKGVCEYLDIAARCPDVHFTLVLNETSGNIREYFTSRRLELPSNVTLHSQSHSPEKHYNNASLVLNLAKKNMFVETFGLTAIEGFSAGLPAIVPTIGGIASLVTEGVDGFHIDAEDTAKIADTIHILLNNKELYLRMASAALQHSRQYSESAIMPRILDIMAR